MSKPVLPWSLKGISPEAREIAKKAAAQQGITIGEWVSRAIRDVGPVSHSDAPPMDVSALTEGSFSRAAEMAAKDVREAIRARIYDSEERVAHMVAPLQDIIDQLSRRLTRIEARVDDRSTPQVDQSDSRRLDGW